MKTRPAVPRHRRGSAPRLALAAAAVWMAWACADGRRQPSPPPPAAGGGAGAAAPAAPGPTPAAQAPDTSAGAAASNLFDPGAVRPGDRVAGMRVVSRDVRRVLEDSVWTGRVEFEGEATVRGTTRTLEEDPSSPLACFTADPASAARLPRFAPDARSGPAAGAPLFFCFQNGEEAFRQLGPAGSRVEAEVVIDRYRFERDFTEVFPTARLVRVVEKRPAPAPRP